MRPADELPATPAAASPDPQPASAVDETRAASSLTWGAIVVRVWLAGVALMLLRLAIGIVWASLTVRGADDLPHTGWLDSLDEAAAALGLTRPVGLKVSSRAAVPMATGLWRAVVLLPPSAIDWPEERRRVVLQHELAHVKRRDCLLQALAQCVCAVHWFNPAAHLAVSSLRAEQERACDDLVIEVGTDARCYADHLFEIARSFRAASFPTWVAMSMARPSQLEGRMLAILDDARVRCAPSPSMQAALLIGTLTIALPFGALRLAAQSSSPSEQASAEAAASAPASAVATDQQSAEDRDDLRDLSADAAHATIDVVHGDLVDIDLLMHSPSLRFGDAIQAGVFDDNGEKSAQLKETEKAFKEATRGQKWLLLQSGTAAQGATAVSDETRKRVADALMSALNDDNPQVRQEALSSLASMRDERAIPGLVRALSDSVAEVRMRALGALVQFDSATAADGVLTALKDRNADVREQAARHLASMVSRGQLRDQKYVDAFLALLKDAAKDVREEAASALGNLADPRAIDALTAALKDTEPAVRERAARALGQIARGQRRGVRPGVVAPPVPPLPPRAFVDQDQIREMTERARELAEDARRDVERAMRDMRRFAPFGVPEPLPVPDPTPAPPAPRR